MVFIASFTNIYTPLKSIHIFMAMPWFALHRLMTFVMHENNYYSIRACYHKSNEYPGLSIHIIVMHQLLNMISNNFSVTVLYRS